MELIRNRYPRCNSFEIGLRAARAAGYDGGTESANLAPVKRRRCERRATPAVAAAAAAAEGGGSAGGDGGEDVAGEKRDLLRLALDGITHSLELEDEILGKQLMTVSDELESLASPLTAAVLEGYIGVLKAASLGSGDVSGEFLRARQEG